MILQEQSHGDYRIYAGAIESPRGGYTAAFVVQHLGGAQRGMRETLRDDSVACGYRWRTAQEAIDYAVHKAREALTKEARTLAA